jgi:hypothetical protein
LGQHYFNKINMNFGFNRWQFQVSCASSLSELVPPRPAHHQDRHVKKRFFIIL